MYTLFCFGFLLFARYLRKNSITVLEEGAFIGLSFLNRLYVNTFLDFSESVGQFDLMKFSSLLSYSVDNN